LFFLPNRSNRNQSLQSRWFPVTDVLGDEYHSHCQDRSRKATLRNSGLLRKLVWPGIENPRRQDDVDPLWIAHASSLKKWIEKSAKLL
jgi:hypothetical protein